MTTSLFALDPVSKKLTSIPVREMVSLGLKETGDLETWLASADTKLFGRKVLWIARQDRVSDEQRSDLIGVADSGDLIVAELKRGQLHEDAITQALCYAADYAQLSADDVAQRFVNHSAKATANGLLTNVTSLAEAQARLSVHVGEETEVNESQILLLVAEDFSAKALSVCDYLNEGEGKFSVECWRCAVCEAADKSLFFTLEQLVPPPSVRQAIDEKREASKARQRARDPMRALVLYIANKGVSVWRNPGQSYECQIEVDGKELWLSIHARKPRFILPDDLELDADPTALFLTATKSWDGKVAYEFGGIDAGKDGFTSAFGDQAVAIIKKVRTKATKSS